MGISKPPCIRSDRQYWVFIMAADTSSIIYEIESIAWYFFEKMSYNFFENGWWKLACTSNGKAIIRNVLPCFTFKFSCSVGAQMSLYLWCPLNPHKKQTEPPFWKFIKPTWCCMAHANIVHIQFLSVFTTVLFLSVMSLFEFGFRRSVLECNSVKPGYLKQKSSYFILGTIKYNNNVTRLLKEPPSEDRPPGAKKTHRDNSGNYISYKPEVRAIIGK